MDHILTYHGLVGVSLGLLQPEYGPDFLPWANAREAIKGTLQRPPYYPENWDGFLDHIAKSKGKHEVFAVLKHIGSEEKPAYEYIGHMGVHNIKWPDGIGATGSILGGKNARGNGLGTEAKLLLLYHCFYVLGLRKVVSTVKAFNGNSLGHLLKCGYKICGRHTKHIFHEGDFVDEILLELHREDFEPIWRKYKETKKLPRLTATQRKRVKKETES